MPPPPVRGAGGPFGWGDGYGSFCPSEASSTPSTVIHLNLHAVSAKLNVPEAVVALGLSRSAQGSSPVGPGPRWPGLEDSEACPITATWICPVEATSSAPAPTGRGPAGAVRLGWQPAPLHASPGPLRPSPSVIIVGSADPAPGLLSPWGPVPRITATCEEGEAVFGGQSHERVFLTLRYSSPAHAWVLLAVGLFGWSASGPLYTLLPPALQQRPFRVAFWRYAGGFLPFLLAAAWHRRRAGPSADHHRWLRPAAWPLLSLLAISTFGGFSAFGQAVALCPEFAMAAGTSALNPFLLVAWAGLAGKGLGPANATGLLLAAVGLGSLLASDGLHSRDGICYGVLASFFFTLYVAAADILRPRVPLPLLLAVTFGLGAVIAGLASVLEGATLGPGPESILGLFGDWHVAGIAGSLVALYALGLTGLTACASDLPPVVLAVALTLEPLLSVALAIAAGQARPPHPMTLGLALIVAGSVVVGVQASVERRAERRVDVTEAAVQGHSPFADHL